MDLQHIQSKIFEIRGYKVMLDFDLAEMYQVETRVLNQSVKRNIERFPNDFMFQLTLQEWENISSQFVTTSRLKRPKSALPFAFTEHGVTMLSGILKSDIAIQVNIHIVRAFVAMRQIVLNRPLITVENLAKEIKELREYVEEIITDTNEINEDTRIQIEIINEAIAELQISYKAVNKPRHKVGFIKPTK
ncbi:MAG: ORF6N domain-containing protein [Tannerellaceae bacterium]|nr:ORF6N domain-containing protein [Tannerellaceae bacterium]